MLPGKTYGPEDVLRVLRNRIWTLVLPLAIVAAATAVFVSRLPDRYRSETVVLVVPQRVPESYVRSTVTSRIEDRLQAMAQQILSRTRLERIIQDFNLYQEERRTEIMEDIVEQMRRDIDLQVVRSDNFRISFTGSDPRTVMRVTERLASFFIEENLRDREVLAEGTNQFLEAQLEDARRRLVEQERKLEAYRRRFSGQLPTQLDSNLQVLQNMQMQVQAVVESVNRDRDRRLILERQVVELEREQEAASATALLANQGDRAAPPTPAQQLANARASLAALQTRLKPDHPDVQRLARFVRDLERKVVAEEADAALSPAITQPVSPNERARRQRLSELRAEMEQLDRQLATKQTEEQRLRGQIGSYEKRVEAAPTRESELVELTRDYETLQGLYKNLLANREESKIAANLERRQIGEQFRLIDPARIPERPFSPDRPRLNLLGVLGGLVLGFILIAILEYLDKSFKNDQEVMRVLSLPVLAVVPFMQSASERKWAFRKRVLFNIGCSTVVVGCLAVVVYTFIR
jgi:protein tyrosine kinase modulator